MAVINVDANHHAQHQMLTAGQVDDVVQPAFHHCGGLFYKGHVDHSGLCFLQAGLLELVNPLRIMGASDVHGIAQRVGDHVDAKFTGGANIGHGILALVAVDLARTGGKHHHWRVFVDGVKKRIGGKVGAALCIAGGNPADRAGRDNCLERVVGQAVAFGGVIEHFVSLRI